ncbi:SusC/RagA family TonB-linked outer membrane protein [Ancylomarina sp.]|uniref:SusC/RagA family TonB-linked outer membrane protein n=1 Tax=Ancylomarina sp. TaxID=1970196 RepID=UPI003564D0B2
MKKMIGLSLFLFLLGVQIVLAQTKQITGKVISDEDGLGIPGVSVVLKGTTIGTSTNIDGAFTIEAQNSDILVFSFVGMQIQEVPVGTKTVLNVTMSPESLSVDEVVVVGYASKKKGAITGAVSTISADKLEQVPVASFDNALQGQTAGVQVMASSGRPGAAASIRIRGVSSINAGTEPLVIMDGVPISNGDFSSLNVNDIESISILKDAASTAIYGARGANGVIVVTSKRGISKGKTEITYRGQYGLSKLARSNFDMMNTEEKLRYEIELGLRGADDPINAELSKVNVNWRDEVFRDAPMQSHEISVRGGNNKTRFFLSGGYYDQEGIQYRSDFKRYTGRINLDHNASDKLKLGTSITLGLEENNYTTTTTNSVYNPAFVGYLMNPYLKARRDDGSYTTPEEDGLPFGNPLQQLDLNEDFSTKVMVQGNVFAEYRFTDYLKFKTTVGVDFKDYVDKSYTSPESAWGLATEGQVGRSFSRIFKLNTTNLLSFNKTFNEVHDVSAFAGFESLEGKVESFGVSAIKLPSSHMKMLSTAAEYDGTPNGSVSEYALLSFLGSASYGYNGKYYADFTYRREGSSRFGEDVRWADFWAVGARWNAKSESFLASNEMISALSFKVGVGTSGNWEIGNYSHMNLYGFGIYNGDNSSAPIAPGNPDLTWEQLMKINLGVDLGLFNRVNLAMDVYHETTSDMLFDVPLSLTSGFSSRWSNVGSMVNRGAELTINADIINSGDFNWNLSANVGYNQSEITELYDGKDEFRKGSLIYKVGESYGQMYYTRFAGVDPATGKNLWLTKDDKITDNFSEDDAVMLEGKSFIAPWTGGFTNTFSYKGLTVQAFFSWVKDKYMLNNTRYFIESNGQFASFNQTKRMLNYWKKPGDITDIPKPNGQTYFDSRLVEDASFLRLKNLMVAYTVPKDFIERIKGVEGVRVYAQGQNLLTFSKYSGFDPEFDGVVELGMYPQVKTFTFGVDVKF